MRTTHVFGAVALSVAATFLTACGSDDSGGAASGDYCSELKADAKYFNGLDSSDPASADLDQIFTRMHTLAGEAPDDVADDWKKLDEAFTTIENALKDAGIKPSDLAGLQSGQVPPNVDPSKLSALLPKLQALSTGDVPAAAQRIATNAKDTCGVDLDNSAS